jgi:hypothetical protein
MLNLCAQDRLCFFSIHHLADESLATPQLYVVMQIEEQ